MNIFKIYLLFGDFSYISKPDRRLLDFSIDGTVFNYGYMAWTVMSCLLLMDQASGMTAYAALPDALKWSMIALYGAAAVFSAIYAARIRSDYAYLFMFYGFATPLMIYRLVGMAG